MYVVGDLNGWVGNRVWMKYIREKKKVNLKVPLRLRKERWMFVSTYEPGRKKKENDDI